MPRMGGPSRGCRICRERKIKCDELAPQCLQCISSGRQCPGPITGALINDMTPKFMQAYPHVQPPSMGNESEILPAVQHRVRDRAEIVAPPAVDSVSSTATNELVTIRNVENLSRTALIYNAIKLFTQASKVGATIDPFHTLPLNIGGKSAQNLFDYCSNGMSSSLIPFGSMDPMHDVWLPWVASDQLLLASMLFRASVHLSVLNPSTGIESAIWRGATLSLLNKRLASPSQAVNDITIASVLLLTHQSIVSGDIEETKLHMEGLQRMLTLRGSYTPMAPVQEILFWTDLLGSALTHQPMRNYAPKPDKNLLPCLPLNLYPRTTISNLCVAFQPFLSTPLFSQLIDPLHEVRCLTIAFHFSGQRANLEIPIFSQLCRSNRMKCQLLLKTSGSDTFDLCLLAIMIFLDSILLSDSTGIPLLSNTLQTTFKSMTLAEISQMDKKLMLWLLYMGSATAQDRKLASWYREHFANTRAILHVLSLEAAKSILVEFLWVDGACDQKLAEIWKLDDVKPSKFVSDGV